MVSAQYRKVKAVFLILLLASGRAADLEREAASARAALAGEANSELGEALATVFEELLWGEAKEPPEASRPPVDSAAQLAQADEPATHGDALGEEVTELPCKANMAILGCVAFLIVAPCVGWLAYKVGANKDKEGGWQTLRGMFQSTFEEMGEVITAGTMQEHLCKVLDQAPTGEDSPQFGSGPLEVGGSKKVYFVMTTNSESCKNQGEGISCIECQLGENAKHIDDVKESIETSTAKNIVLYGSEICPSDFAQTFSDFVGCLSLLNMNKDRNADQVYKDFINKFSKKDSWFVRKAKQTLGKKEEKSEFDKVVEVIDVLYPNWEQGPSPKTRTKMDIVLGV